MASSEACRQPHMGRQLAHALSLAKALFGKQRHGPVVARSKLAQRIAALTGGVAPWSSVGEETAAGLAPQPTGRDHFLEQRGGAVLAVAEAFMEGLARSASRVSRPIRSARASGPMGWLQPRRMPVSMSSAPGQAFLAHEDRLVDHRHQDAVDHEAWAVACGDRGLADASQSTSAWA